LKKPPIAYYAQRNRLKRLKKPLKLMRNQKTRHLLKTKRLTNWKLKRLRTTLATAKKYRMMMTLKATATWSRRP